MTDCKYYYDEVCCNDSCKDMIGDFPDTEYCEECEFYEKGKGVNDKSGISN